MHGLLAVKVEKDGRHIDVALAALSQIFNDKSQHNSIGDIFEKDGIMWWTPGNGCSTFTKWSLKYGIQFYVSTKA